MIVTLKFLLLYYPTYPFFNRGKIHIIVLTQPPIFGFSAFFNRKNHKFYKEYEFYK